MTSGRVRVPGQDVIRRKRQQRDFELVQITQAPGGRITDQRSVNRDPVALEIVHHLAELGLAARFFAIADHVNNATAFLRAGGKSLSGRQDRIVQGMDFLGDNSHPGVSPLRIEIWVHRPAVDGRAAVRGPLLVGTPR